VTLFNSHAEGMKKEKSKVSAAPPVALNINEGNAFIEELNKSINDNSQN